MENLKSNKNNCYHLFFAQTFRSLSFAGSPSTATGLRSVVTVQVRVEDHDSSQFSHLAKLAGVSPPMTEADLLTAEQRELQSRQHKERRGSNRGDLMAQLDLSSEFQSRLFMQPSL